MLRFTMAAQEEVLAAIDYYERQNPGLGQKLREALAVALHEIEDAPLRWPQIEAGCHRHRVMGFPYGAVYRIEMDEVVVYALMHLHRAPGYWSGRG